MGKYAQFLSESQSPPPRGGGKYSRALGHKYPHAFGATPEPEPEPGPETDSQRYRREAAERAEEIRSKPWSDIFTDPEAARERLSAPLRFILPGLDTASVQAGLEQAFGGENLEERASGVIEFGKGIATPALAAAGTMGVGAVGAAARAGGPAAAAKMLGMLGLEGVGGYALEEKVVRPAIEAVGEKTGLWGPNVSALTSFAGTLPIGITASAASVKGYLNKLHKRKAAAEAAASGLKTPSDTFASPPPLPPRESAPVPGAKITTAAVPEQAVRQTVPESTGRAARVSALDAEIDKTTAELRSIPNPAPEVRRAYEDRLDQLVSQRDQAAAGQPAPAALPPASEAVVEIPRGRARELAAEIEQKLAGNLSKIERARLEAEYASLREYGGSPNEQTEMLLFPERLGPEIEGTLPPEISRGEIPGWKGRAASAAKRAENLAARGGDPAKLQALAEKYRSDLAVRSLPTPAKQADITIPEQAPFPQAGVDLTIRPSERVYSVEGSPVPKEPPVFEGAPPPSRAADLGFEPREVYDPGTQGVLLPSRETLDLNYPTARRLGQRYNRQSRESMAAAEKARGIRDRLANRDLSDVQRARLEEELAKTEALVGRQSDADKEWLEAGQALQQEEPKSFLDYLTKQADDQRKAQKGVTVKEAPSFGGTLPARKWIGDRASGKRTPVETVNPMRKLQLRNRLESLEAIDAAEPVSVRRTDEINRTRAELARIESSEIRVAARRDFASRYEDAKPALRTRNTVEPETPGSTTQGELASDPRAGLRGLVRRIFYDSDWQLRNIASHKDPAIRAQAEPILHDLADRIKSWKVTAGTRASRDYSRLWRIDPDREIGLQWITDEEQLNLRRVIENNDAPINDRVAIIAETFNNIKGTIADTTESMAVQAYDARTQQWRPFMRRTNYAPRIIPSLEKLATDQAVRARVLANMEETLGIDQVLGKRMLDAYVSMRKSRAVDKKGNPLVDWLVETGQATDLLEAARMLEAHVQPRIARSSSLEYARSMDLPFYDPNLKDSLQGWLSSTHQRLAWIEEFGQEIPAKARKAGVEGAKPTRLADVPNAEQEQIYEVRKTLDELLKELEDAAGKEIRDEAAQRMGAVLNRLSDSDMARTVSQVVRTTSLLRLSYLAAENIFQGMLGSMLRGNIDSTLKGLKRSFSDEALRIAVESGSRKPRGDEGLHSVFFGGEDDSLVKMQRAVNVFMKYTGVKGSENWNRQVTSAAGVDYILGLYERLADIGGPSAPARKGAIIGRYDDAGFIQRELKKLQLPVHRDPTDEEMLRAAFMFDRDVNFEVDPWLRPPASNSELGKVVTLFWNWRYQQARLLYNETWARIVRGKKLGDANETIRGFRNLIILATVYPSLGVLARLGRAGARALTAGAGAALAEMQGGYPDPVEGPLEELHDESAMVTYLRAAGQLGAIPAPAGDIIESYLRFGRPPTMTRISGDIPADQAWALFGRPVGKFVKTVGEEMEYGPYGDPVRPLRETGAELIKGAFDAAGGGLKDAGVPASRPFREWVAGHPLER